jgi:hypothetical protein
MSVHLQCPSCSLASESHEVPSISFRPNRYHLRHLHSIDILIACRRPRREGDGVVSVAARQPDESSPRIDRVTQDISRSPDSRASIPPSLPMSIKSSEIPYRRWGRFNGAGLPRSKSHSNETNETSLRPSGESAELPRLGISHSRIPSFFS